MTEVASEPQRKYIRTLVGQIDWSDLDTSMRDQTLETAGKDNLPSAAAGDIIDTLKRIRGYHSLRFGSRSRR